MAECSVHLRADGVATSAAGSSLEIMFMLLYRRVAARFEVEHARSLLHPPQIENHINIYIILMDNFQYMNTCA